MSEHRFWAPPPARDGRIEVGPGVALDVAATLWAETAGHLVTNLLCFDSGGARLVFDSHEADWLADHCAADSLEVAHAVLVARALEDMGLPQVAIQLRDMIADAPLGTALPTARTIARIAAPQPRLLAVLLTEAPPGGRRLAWFVDADPATPPADLVRITTAAACALHPSTDPAHA